MLSQTHATATKAGRGTTVTRDVTLGASIVARMIQISALSVQEIKLLINVTLAWRIGMNRWHVILNALTVPIFQQMLVEVPQGHANATKGGLGSNVTYHAKTPVCDVYRITKISVLNAQVTRS